MLFVWVGIPSSIVLMYWYHILFPGQYFFLFFFQCFYLKETMWVPLHKMLYVLPLPGKRSFFFLVRLSGLCALSATILPVLGFAWLGL